MTFEKYFRSKLREISKKNKFCAVLIMPVLAAGIFTFHLRDYLISNCKRYSIAAISGILCVIYGSFTFPIFTKGVLVTEEEKISEVTCVVDHDESVGAGEGLLDYEAILYDFAEDFTVDTIPEETSQVSFDFVEKCLTREEEMSLTEESVQGKVLEKNSQFSADDWRLILVNNQNAVPEGYEPPLQEMITMGGVLRSVDERIMDILQTMMKDAARDGVKLLICSPYRSRELQEEVFGQKLNAYLKTGMSYADAFYETSRTVALPGHSEHQLGLAIDFMASNYYVLDEGFGEIKAGIWLRENCHKYGFILRYPKGKEEITGIDYEPWHFRYVGSEAAAIMMGEDLTLEEFWEEYL